MKTIIGKGKKSRKAGLTVLLNSSHTTLFSRGVSFKSRMSVDGARQIRFRRAENFSGLNRKFNVHRKHFLLLFNDFSFRMYVIKYIQI